METRLLPKRKTGNGFAEILCLKMCLFDTRMAKNMYWNIIKWAHDNLNKDNDMPDAPTDGSAITTSEAGNTLTGVSGDNKWTITLESDGHLHYKLVKVSYFPTDGGAQKDLSGASLDAFHSSMGRIQKYDKGVCYYEIFIRHFTDEEGGYAPIGRFSLGKRRRVCTGPTRPVTAW